MNATRWMASLAVTAVLSLLGWSVAPVAAQDAGAAPKQQPYTMAEYNAFTACSTEKNPAAQIKCLDDFVAKFPNSALLHFVYPLYYKNYLGQKNFQKAIEYADKEVAQGEKATPGEIYEAYYIRAAAYNNLQNPDPQTAKAARDAALAGLKSLDLVPKPEGMDDAKFAEQKKPSVILFNFVAGNAGLAAKDCAGAAESYKVVLALTPDDVASNYNLGKAYSCVAPPQDLDALWFFARAATSKNATEQQSKPIKAYIRKLIANHQGNTVCDALTDAEMNELLQLASTSLSRPSSYKLISSAELDAARKDMTIASVFTDLKAGGDKAKLTWTAACGLEFPDVPGKIIEVTPGPDAVVLKNAFVTSDAEFDAKNTPDMEITIKTADQPEAAKLEKGNAMRFTGTLESYDPDPAFMLHWDKAKANPEDLPKAGTTTKKPAPKRPTKKP